MFDFVSAMEIFAKYHDYPSFDYDQTEKMIDTAIGTDEIPESCGHGMRLVDLGWEVGNTGNWVMFL